MDNVYKIIIIRLHMRDLLKINIRADLRVLYGLGGSIEFIKFFIICVCTLQTDGRSKEGNPETRKGLQMSSVRPIPGKKRHGIPQIYKYHIALHNVPSYCGLCHFIATEKKKLVDHVTQYAKHTEAAKDLGD